MLKILDIKNHKSNTGEMRIKQKQKFNRKLYRQSERGKVAQKRYTQSEKCKATKKRYRQSRRGKILRKIARKSCDKKYVIAHPKQIKAIYKVYCAITSGKMPRPDTLQCISCPAQAQHYHHSKGYEPEHWFDVIPVCRNCHREIHKKSA